MKNNKSHTAQSKVLAIFDFDGTITKGDSFLAYLRYVGNTLQFMWYLFLSSPVVILYKVGILTNGTAKEYIFKRFFKGMEESKIRAMTDEFTETKLESMIRPEAMATINSHLASNHTVIILSATPDLILSSFCKNHNLTLISTQAEVQAGMVTGKFSSPNCYGEEKVRRLKVSFDLQRFDYIYAYGDRKSDRAFLKLADTSFYKPFRSNVAIHNN